jgi:hypothetical protein
VEPVPPAILSGCTTNADSVKYPNLRQFVTDFHLTWLPETVGRFQRGEDMWA